jgi:hypothetical protein
MKSSPAYDRISIPAVHGSGMVELSAARRCTCNETRIGKAALVSTGFGSLLAAIGGLLSLWLALSSPMVVRPAFGQFNSAAVCLEAGVAKEDVDGDLKSAMEIYQKIAADLSAPRDVGAKALLRLAGCYEKLGRQARQVYEQIVRDYADQPAASQARTRLASLKQLEHPAAPTTMTVRKIEWSAVGRRFGRSQRMIFKAEPDRAPGWIPARDFAMACIGLPSKPNHPRVLAVVKTDGTGYPRHLRGWFTGKPECSK